MARCLSNQIQNLSYIYNFWLYSPTCQGFNILNSCSHKGFSTPQESSQKSPLKSFDHIWGSFEVTAAIPQGHLTQHFYGVTGCNVSTTLKIHTALPSEIIEIFFRSQTFFIFSANPEQRLQYYLLDAYLFQLSFIQADISGSGQNVQRLP